MSKGDFGNSLGARAGALGGGAFGLLLKNELRLWWRQIRDAKYFWAWMIFGLVTVGSVLLLLWLGFSALRMVTAGAVLPAEAIWVAVGLWLLSLMFAFNQAMRESIVVLFERGDLDVLLSSPVPARAIFAVRLVTVALKVFFGFGVFVIPAGIVAVLVGFPALLGMYPALASICVMAASLGMLVTLQVVRWVGAKRARSLVQFLNLLLSLGVIVGFQIPNYLLTSGFDVSRAWQRFQAWAAPGTAFGVDSWVWFPARAVLFDPLSVVLMLGMSGAIAAATVLALENTFVQGTQQSLTQKGTRTRGSQKESVWRGGFNRVMLKKEWRTMLRHPYLVSQVAFQVILILPLTWILIQGGEADALFDMGRIANLGLPFLAGQLAYSLTFICLSGEEAPDLLKSSPMASHRLRRLKQAAALIPVWVVLSPAFLVLIWRGEVWLPALVAALGASVSASLLRLWNSRPAAIGTLFRQRQLNKSDFLLMVVEIGSPWLWVLMGSALYNRSVALVLFTVILLGIVYSVSYFRAKQIGSFLHY
ncbi:MAG: hypothetical protein AAF703_16330 [Cyanobacteria bacterium P01_D01_bin.105]